MYVYNILFIWEGLREPARKLWSPHPRRSRSFLLSSILHVRVHVCPVGWRKENPRFRVLGTSPQLPSNPRGTQDSP